MRSELIVLSCSPTGDREHSPEGSSEKQDGLEQGVASFWLQHEIFPSRI